MANEANQVCHYTEVITMNTWILHKYWLYCMYFYSSLQCGFGMYNVLFKWSTIKPPYLSSSKELANNQVIRIFKQKGIYIVPKWYIKEINCLSKEALLCMTCWHKILIEYCMCNVHMLKEWELCGRLLRRLKTLVMTGWTAGL